MRMRNSLLGIVAIFALAGSLSRGAIAASADDEIHFVRKIDCEFVDGHDPEASILYTRLDRFKSRAQLPAPGHSITTWDSAHSSDRPFPDEIAFGPLGKIYGAWLGLDEFHYHVSNGESEEREYVFKNPDLWAGEGQIVAKVLIVQGDDPSEFALKCVTHY